MTKNVLSENINVRYDRWMYMKKSLYGILFGMLTLLFINVNAASDELMQTYCDDPDETSRIIYALKGGEIRHLFCNNAFDNWFEDEDICSSGSEICLNRATKTITLKNFDGRFLFIDEVDLDGDGNKDNLNFVYEGNNVFTPEENDLYSAAIYSLTSLNVKSKDSSSSLIINVNKRKSSIYRDGITLADGNLTFDGAHNLSISVNATCLPDTDYYSAIKSQNGKLVIKHSNILIDVKDAGETCSSNTITRGVGIVGANSDVVIGDDESEVDTRVVINTELEAIRMTGVDDVRTFRIKEQVSSDEELNGRENPELRDTKVFINYNSKTPSIPLINFTNAKLDIEGWIKISANQIDPSVVINNQYNNPVLFTDSGLDILEDGAFVISASSNDSILKFVGSTAEVKGLLHVHNLQEDKPSIKLTKNDTIESSFSVVNSACSIEDLNIVDGVYKDSEIKWTYGSKLVSNKNTDRPVYINSKKALHYGWLAKDSIANSDVNLNGIASANILDKGIAKLTKNSSLNSNDIFSLPTKESTYQVLTRINNSSVTKSDNLKLHLAKLEGNNYVQVGEVLTTEARTLKVGTMSELVYNVKDMEDYTGLADSTHLYYSFELTADQLNSGVYYILEIEENKTYFEDESSAQTGIRIYPSRTLTSNYQFLVTSSINNDVKSKIDIEISNLGFPSTDYATIGYYKFSLKAGNEVAPDGTYKIKIPTHGAYASEAQIYAFNSSGTKLDRTFAATMEDDYYVFGINKTDLDSTIFALVDFGQINSLKDSSHKYILTAGHNEIYSGCKFNVNIGSQMISGNVTQDNKSFELNCGENYTLPNIEYTIIIPKPEGTSFELYDGVNTASANKVSLTPTEDTLSFKVSNTDIDSTPRTYALTYYTSYVYPCAPLEQRMYKIKFNTDGGNRLPEETVTIGSEGEDLPIPEKEGYTFDYWQYSDGTKVTATKTTGVLRDADKIVRNDSNGCPTEYYETIELKSIWKQSSGCTDATMNFKVIYNVDGGNAISEETVTSSTTKNIPTPTKNDHKFLGWYSDSAKTKKITVTKLKDLASPRKDGSTCITGYNDVTLYASWEKITTYTVTFVTDEGTPVPAPQKIEVNGKATIPTEPTKKGYSFKEWQLNGIAYDFNKDVTSDITLNAVWTENSSCENIKKEFKLTYYGEDKTVKVTEDTTDELPLSSHCGYSIKGWCYDEACTKPISNDTLLKDLNVKSLKDENDCITGYENLTIYPNIEKASTEIDKRSIFLNYFTNGGNELVEERDVLDINFDELLVPTRNGYTFEGWYKDEELSEKITEEKWKQIQQESYEWISKDPACHLSLIALYAKWIENETEVVSVGGAQITHELIDDASKFEFVVDQLTENETAFISGILENAKKTADPKKIIDIYKFNLNAKDEGTVLPGGKYQIQLPITENMNKYDKLELVALDEKGNITERKIELTKEDNYYVLEVDFEDLGKTNFALIGNEIKQVSTGIPFKIGSFVILIFGFGFLSLKIKKSKRLYKI